MLSRFLEAREPATIEAFLNAVITKLHLRGELLVKLLLARHEVDPDFLEKLVVLNYSSGKYGKLYEAALKELTRKDEIGKKVVEIILRVAPDASDELSKELKKRFPPVRVKTIVEDIEDMDLGLTMEDVMGRSGISYGDDGGEIDELEMLARAAEQEDSTMRNIHMLDITERYDFIKPRLEHFSARELVLLFKKLQDMETPSRLLLHMKKEKIVDYFSSMIEEDFANLPGMTRFAIENLEDDEVITKIFEELLLMPGDRKEGFLKELADFSLLKRLIPKLKKDEPFQWMLEMLEYFSGEERIKLYALFAASSGGNINRISSLLDCARRSDQIYHFLKILLLSLEIPETLTHFKEVVFYRNLVKMLGDPKMQISKIKELLVRNYRVENENERREKLEALQEATAHEKEEVRLAAIEIMSRLGEREVDCELLKLINQRSEFSELILKHMTDKLMHQNIEVRNLYFDLLSSLDDYGLRIIVNMIKQIDKADLKSMALEQLIDKMKDAEKIIREELEKETNVRFKKRLKDLLGLR